MLMQFKQLYTRWLPLVKGQQNPAKNLKLTPSSVQVRHGQNKQTCVPSLAVGTVPKVQTVQTQVGLSLVRYIVVYALVFH